MAGLSKETLDRAMLAFGITPPPSAADVPNATPQQQQAQAAPTDTANRFLAKVGAVADPYAQAVGIPSAGQAAEFVQGIPGQVQGQVQNYWDTHPGNARLVNDAKNVAGGFLGNAIPDIHSNPQAPAQTDLQPVPEFARGLGGSAPRAAPLPTLQDPMQSRPVGGGYGGGSGMGSLARNVAADQAGILGSFEQDKANRGEQGQLEAQKLQGEADLQAQQRARYEQAQRIEAQREQIAQQKAQEFAQASAKLNDDISEQKIDPMRLVHNADLGTRATMTIGGILGGMLEAGGYTKDNPYIAKLERDMAADVSAQQKAIDNKRAGLAQRDNLFGQFRAISGDARLAALQSQDAMMKSAQMQLQEYANRSDVPLVAQRAKMGVQAIEEARQQYKLGIDQHLLTVAQQQAAAWAAQQQAAADKAWSRSMDVAKLQLEGRKIDVDEGKARSASEKDANKGVYTFPDGTQRRAMSEEALNKWTEFQSVVPVIKSQIGELKQAYERGDRAAYDQIREKLKDSNPDIMGRNRAPSKGEVAGEGGEHGGGGTGGGEGTVGSTIPTYDELLKTDTKAKYNMIPGVGVYTAANRFFKGNPHENLNRLDRWVDEYGKQREVAAFGEQRPNMPGSFKADK